MRSKQRSREVVVFSGWSRKAYAIFASLKKVVRIARLSIDICLMSLLKNPSVVQFMDIFNTEKDEPEELEIEQESDLLLLAAVLPVVSKSDVLSSDNEDIKPLLESPYFVQCKIWAFVFGSIPKLKFANKIIQK